ncbi:hypothetical protein KPL71_014804 [Citrus sinensis]|uniref:Uncharacterized protein n=1 Tax=Citrus sinensis TaxID=2711 RepID=A0ACB8KE84_CITSI|nr:hypothetical protein KPL71_014804 [Citrus sinensis]
MPTLRISRRKWRSWRLNVRAFSAGFQRRKKKGKRLKRRLKSGWLVRSANGIIDRAAKFIEDEESTNKRCVKGLSPNWKSRYQLSKKAETEVKAIIELGEEVKKFDTVSHRTIPEEIWLKSSSGYEAFESRLSTLQSIKNALTEANVSFIGVYGIGGIGKTTLMKEFARQAREKSCFMGGFTRDNIWKHLELGTVGIPFGNNHKGCRLLRTARDNNVLSSMGSKDNFLIGNLTEQEAWRLFKIMNGDDVENCKFKSTAINVAKACGGLPIALRALRNKSLHEWKNALRELRTPSMVNFEGNSVWFSDLFRYSMGLGIFQGVNIPFIFTKGKPLN